MTRWHVITGEAGAMDGQASSVWTDTRKLMSLPEPLSRRLWLDSEIIALLSLYHPFVRGIADGTLPRNRFQFYVAQDAHFLAAFQAAYEAAACKAAAEGQEKHAAVLRKMQEGIAQELLLHTAYAQEWGVDLAKELVPSAATTAYVHFLEQVASSEGVMSILAAMAPCCRLYGFIGLALAAAYPDVQHAYKDWIATYSSAPYLSVPDMQEALMNEIGDEGNYGHLRDLYRTAMRLEAEFFDAAAGPALPAPEVGLLVLDFDETLSVADSTSVVISTAIAEAEKAAQGDAGKALRETLEQKRDDLVAGYSRERDDFLDDLLPEDGAAAVPRPFDMGWAAEFVDELSDFDRRMNKAVTDSGILTHVPRHALFKAGRSIQLQPGAVSLLQRAWRAGAPTHIVSVSWSAEMLRGALCGRVPVARGDTTPRPGQVVVHANDLEYSEEGVSTGDLERRIECGVDKAAVLDALLLSAAASRSAQHHGTAPDNTPEPLSVFVGDSMGDLAPLLSADLGIIVGQNRLLRRVASVAGVTLRPLVAAPVSGRSEEGTLYEADSLAHIEAFLFGSSTEWRQPIRVPRVLTIAGSDSGGGAGIQADLKTFQAHGVYGASAITAVTEQNTHGVAGSHTVPLATLAGQIDAVLGDIGADVVKTGMLPSAEVVELVAERVRAHGVASLVVDPVLLSTSGHALGDSGAARAMVASLFPLATIVTPNLPEASALLGGRAITDVDAMQAAARDLHALGPQAVLVKGGHLATGDGGAVDVLFDGVDCHLLAAPLVETGNTHGTGCTTASAIAAEMAKGRSLLDAVRAAKEYVSAALAASAPLQIGTGTQRPFHHGFETADWAAGAAAAQLLDLRLYAVTDPRQNERCGRSNAQAVLAAIEGGTTIVQLREKDAPGGKMLREAEAVIAVARPRGVATIINDRLDVALACGAEGAHIGQEDLPAAQARAILGPHRLLGVSCKTVEQALAAEAGGADYLGCGALHATNTKDSSIITLDTLSDICAAVSIPVVAIGGIAASNAAPPIQAGCAGVAVVSAIFGAQDPAAAARELRGIVDGALGL